MTRMAHSPFQRQRISSSLGLVLISSIYVTIAATTLKQVPGWPSDLNKFDVNNFTSTAVGYTDGTTEKVIFIAQRKKNAYKDAILAVSVLYIRKLFRII
jgi:hypothetical protein